MFSEGNKKAIRDAGLHYIIGTTFKDLPYVIAQWRRDHPGQDYTDKQIWVEADRTGLQIAGQTVHAASPLPAEVTELIQRINPGN